MTHPLQNKMRPWCLRGEVIHGHGRAVRDLGSPTANVKLGEAALKSLSPYVETVMFGWGCIEPEVPSQGEDISNANLKKTQIKDAHLGPFPIALSVATNLFYNDNELSVEAYFLHEFPEDFYGRIIRIIALDIVRVQTSFDSLEALIKAIEGDMIKIRDEIKKPEYEKYKEHEFMNPHTQLSQEVLAQLPYFKEI
ncbi:unnamed protein product [Phytomonas sp. Hart1]|nr:unnamed protein product [Phytomonas sp. Hart1]|eukprot:CCW69490.1 unnamed protein product [Phytomonas sp. isolate Hart1]